MAEYIDGGDIHTNDIQPSRIATIGCYAQLYTGLLPNDFDDTNEILNNLNNAKYERIYKFVRNML